MTNLEKQWFADLVKDREENARILAKDSMRGYRQSPIDKYSDRAHFVFEFLQNADDTKATTCSFVVDKGAVVFCHNGLVPFSVSNPRTEKIDRENGRLGGVNAITAAGMSTKVDGNQIGRFGIGFKAVFQYTESPSIYDDNIAFVLKDEIIPHLLDVNWSDRNPGETYFHIPYRIVDSSRAYTDISNKVTTLSYPLLFLSHLTSISFRTSEITGVYAKRVFESCSYKMRNGSAINVEFVRLQKTVDRTIETFDGLKFSSQTPFGRISIVFGISRNDKDYELIPLSEPAFCYFRTKKETGLKFLIHAPFLLNDSREGIKEGETYNDLLIAALSLLSTNAVYLMAHVLPDEVHDWFGVKRRGVKLITDQILKIIPLAIDSREGEVSFKSFVVAFRELFCGESVIPCVSDATGLLGYTCKADAVWSADGELVKLLSPAQLSQLEGRSRAYWVFPTVKDKYGPSYNFIQSCVGHEVSLLDIVQKMDREFIRSQEISWIGQLCECINKDIFNVDKYKSLPIFIDNLNNVSSAFDAQGNQILFLPGNQCAFSKTIDVRLLKCEGVQKLVTRWGLKKASLLSDLKRVVREELCSAQENQYVERFRSIVNYCSTCTDEELIEIVKVFRATDSLLAFNPATAKCGRRSARCCYYPTDDLMFYFEGSTDVWFVDIRKYKEIVGNAGERGLQRLMVAMEMRQSPPYWLELSRDQISELYGGRTWHSSYRRQSEKWTDLYIKGCRTWFRRFQGETNSEIQLRMSVIFWQYCCEMVRMVVSGHEHIEDKLQGVHRYFYNYQWQEESYETYLHNLLKNTIWLFDNSGEMRRHADLVVEKMNDLYDVKSKEAWQLLELLGIRHDEKLMALNLLSEEDRRDLALVKDIRGSGLGNLSDAKILLERIPAEVRHKICTGVLSAEKILQAVVHLEQTQKVADNYVVASQKGGDEEASGDVGQARGVDVVMTLADNRMSGASQGEKSHMVLSLNDTENNSPPEHGLADHDIDKDGDAAVDKRRKGLEEKYGDIEDEEYELLKLMDDDLSLEEKQDQNKLACIRLFRHLQAAGLEPSMYGSSDPEHVVRTLYAEFRRGPNISINTGKTVHVISAMGGLAYFPPRWWRSLTTQFDGTKEICIMYGARAGEFKFVRQYSDVLQLIDDKAIIVKISGQDADERMSILSKMFDNVEAPGKVYGLLKMRDAGDRYKWAFMNSILDTTDEENHSDEVISKEEY